MTIQCDMSGSFGDVVTFRSVLGGGSAAAMGAVSHWVNAARFALYTRMHATAQEYLNKATLIASLSGSDDCTDEIERLADELRTRLAGVTP